MDLELGSGEVFWAIFWLSLWGAWVFMVVMVWLQVFRSRDLSGVAKAIWTALILLLPLVGVLLYLCIRGVRVDDDHTVAQLESWKAAGPSRTPPSAT